MFTTIRSTLSTNLVADQIIHGAHHWAYAATHTNTLNKPFHDLDWDHHVAPITEKEKAMNFFLTI